MTLNSKPVLVTGATGYLASWIVKKLLSQGTSVHCAVRDPEDESKIEHLKKLERTGDATIKFFKTDLLEEASYNKAMTGCEVVIHTASPFFYDDKQDAKSKLFDPAVNGIENVLKSINRTESVKRLVLTSSVASLFGDTKEGLNKTDNMMNEEDWNNTSTLDNGPYSFSKTQAERKAWGFNKDQDRWELVVVNPSWIIGPAVNPSASFESKKIFKQFCNGTMLFGCPNLEVGIVDVRDVADAHIKATKESVKSGRYIVSAKNINMLYIGKTLIDRIGGFLFPRFFVPNKILWMIAPLAGFSRDYVSNNIGYPIKFDNSKGIKELGIKYNPTEQTIEDFYNQLYSK